MKKTAIICPGPSLEKTWCSTLDGAPLRRSRHYETTIAVNRAALKGCDYWVAGDWMYLKETEARPDVGYCSTREVIDAMKREQIIPYHRWVCTAPLIAWEDLPFQRSYSTVAAIGLAIYLCEKFGCSREVHIFGDDKSGEEDFDGRKGDNRGHSRWQEEIAFTNDAIAFATQRGMTVTHIRE